MFAEMTQSALFIYVVDDEECVRKALARLFRSVGYRVKTFAAGDEFLESLKSELPDCVVLDLHLPVLSGLDIICRMAQTGIKVPTVVITGYDEPGVKEKALSAGAAAYLLKPIDDEELLSNVIQSAVKGKIGEN